MENAILTFIAANPWTARAAICEATGLAPNVVTILLNVLVESGKLARHGQKRGTKYAMPGTPEPEAPEAKEPKRGKTRRKLANEVEAHEVTSGAWSLNTCDAACTDTCEPAESTEAPSDAGETPTLASEPETVTVATADDYSDAEPDIDVDDEEEMDADFSDDAWEADMDDGLMSEDDVSDLAGAVSLDRY